MDAGLVYSQLFNVDGQLDTDLFQDMDLHNPCTPDEGDDKSISLQPENADFFNDTTSYLQYPQSMDTGFFYDHSTQQQKTIIPSSYLQQDHQKQAYDWFSNPFDTILPQTTGIFCDDNMILANDPSTFNYFNNETDNGGMTRSYVSLRVSHLFLFHLHKYQL